MSGFLTKVFVCISSPLDVALNGCAPCFYGIQGGLVSLEVKHLPVVMKSAASYLALEHPLDENASKT